MDTHSLSSLPVGTRFRFADGLDDDADIVYEVTENNEVRVMVRALLDLQIQPVSNVPGSTPVRLAE